MSTHNRYIECYIENCEYNAQCTHIITKGRLYGQVCSKNVVSKNLCKQHINCKQSIEAMSEPPICHYHDYNLCAVVENGNRCKKDGVVAAACLDNKLMCSDHYNKIPKCKAYDCYQVTDTFWKTEMYKYLRTHHYGPLDKWTTISQTEWESKFDDESVTNQWYYGNYLFPRGDQYCSDHVCIIRFDKPDNCPICLDSMNNITLPLNCGHWLHRKCLVNWSDVCPVCRMPVNDLTFEEKKQIEIRRAVNAKEREYEEHISLLQQHHQEHMNATMLYYNSIIDIERISRETQDRIINRLNSLDFLRQILPEITSTDRLNEIKNAIFNPDI
jgi:hypothetical protein